jgi:hypothetical protein
MRFSLRAELSAFVSWWVNELREIAESMLGKVAPKLVKSVVVRAEGNALICADSAEPLVLEQNPPVTRAIAVLAPQDVLTHHITLPLAVEREIDRAVDLHLERDLPMARDLVCVDWQVTRKDREARRISVRLLIAHRERVEKLRDLTTALGLRAIRVAAPGSSGELMGNLLPRRARTDRLRLTSLDRRLATVAGALALAAAGLTAGQWIYERAQLADEVEKADALAAKAQSLAHTLQAKTSSASALIGVMSTPDAVDVLTSLTSTVPQDTWAYELDIKVAAAGGYQVKLNGFAPAATTFVDTLEKTPQFEQVRLVSATSAGLGSARDRLQLTARYAHP